MISYKENFMLDYSCENYKNEEALYSKFPILGCHLLDGCLLAPV